MSTDFIISGHSKDLGGFSVFRALPTEKRRHVGPFVFLDHLGPLLVDTHQALDVRPHPHIGLSTVTYLFSGRGLHRDSLGSEQIISPGDLNLMTAGKGIVHSEHTPLEDRHLNPPSRLHGIQIWIALPHDQQECEPSFTHWPKNKLPQIQIHQDIKGTLLIGNHQGIKSPVGVFSPTLFMDLQAVKTTKTTIDFAIAEIGIFLIEGRCQINNQTLQSQDLFISTNPQNLHIQVEAGSRLIVIGGEPFPEKRYIWWNFVSTSKELIKQAAQNWQDQRMGQVAGETDFIPLPGEMVL